ncbi:uncharacterized protein LOC115484405 [Serinus canaria]|uniref:uncharacterized protein LOC115484405 n=1 Tax=Serinus canaria TaxID=9135 RepID=UPI0021CC5822|nr:uncharacterized protein LOC115484405 [Serinus canaria]
MPFLPGISSLRASCLKVQMPLKGRNFFFPLAFQTQQIPSGIFNNTQVIIGGQSQIVTINWQWRVAVIEQRNISGSWKTIWNYDTGVIATKAPQQNACYISIMNRSQMPLFDNLARLAEESRNMIGLFGRHTEITFVTSGLVNNLYSYGIEIMAMCSGLPTYMATEVNTFQGPQVNLGPCMTLDVLRVVELKYCNSNGNWNGIWNNNCHISISGVSQSISINSETQEATMEQNSNDLSWKTIWNFNRGIIATKVMPERTCYISTMNRNEMPTFAALVRMAAERGNLISGFGRPTTKIAFVTDGLVSNLISYGSDVFSMCSGLTTYMTYEVQVPQYNQQLCLALNVLGLVELEYCNGNGQVGESYLS